MQILCVLIYFFSMRMTQIYKLILHTQILLLLLTASICHAAFDVEPSELNIYTGQDSILTVTNSDHDKSFSLILKEGKKVSNDLHVEPSSFTLIPNQEQIIRIRTKHKIDYTDKKYALYIVFDSTTQDTHTHIFKVPISINKGDTTPSIAETLDGSNLPDEVGDDGGGSGGFSQITISVPVTAIVVNN